MLYSLFIILFLSTINSTNLDDIISRFKEDYCIQDDFIDPEIFSQATEVWQSSVYTQGNSPSKNSLSLIHELAQLNKVEYYYYLEKEEGLAHSKFFYITLTLGDESYKGDGMSLKEAKRHAAEEAILHTKYIIPERKGTSNDAELTPTVELNNIAIKLGMKVQYLSEDELKADMLIYKQKNFTIPDGKSFRSHLDKLNYTTYHPYETKKLDVPKENQQGKQFKVGVIVGEMKFIGVGYTLQSAKHDAAKNALMALKKISSKDIEQCINEGVICNPDNNKSPISVLYELAQEKNIQLDFEVINESGPAHEKLFVTRCQFGDLTVEGSGKSKKLSKRNASENMLRELEDVMPSNSHSEFSINEISKKKKKKRKKVIKNKLEKFAIDAKSFISSTWEYAFPDEKQTKVDDSNDNKSKKNKRTDNEENDFKRILLGFTQDSGISTNFIDLGIENSKHYSLLFIGLDPKHVCLGDGQSYDLSRQKASLEALNFFYKLGITTLTPSEETFQYIKNMDFGKIHMVSADIVSKDQSNNKKE